MAEFLNKGKWSEYNTSSTLPIEEAKKQYPNYQHIGSGRIERLRGGAISLSDDEKHFFVVSETKT